MNSYKVINACECCIKYQNKVCLQFRSELNSHYPNYYSFPGGGLDDNEDPASAVKREVKEEAGIDLTNENLQLSVIEFNYHDDDKELWVIYTFKATINNLPAITTSDEGDVNFYNIEDARSLNLVPQTKNYFEHTLKDTKDILIINQNFTQDQITSIVANTIV